MSYPVCMVEIYGREEQWTFTSEASDQRPYGTSPASDLISCRTEKHLHYANPAGRFSLTLVHRPDSRGRTWADRVQPQDLVVIQMLNYGQPAGPHGQGQQHTVMIGLVDTITIVARVDGSGKPQRQIAVKGQDFGKLFQRGNVTYWSFAGASLVGAAEFVAQEQLNGHPHTVAEVLLTELFFKFMKPEWVFNQQTVTFKDILGYALSSYQSLFPGGLDWQFILSEQAFWSFFVKVASVPFHEVFIDTRRTADMGPESADNPLSRPPRPSQRDLSAGVLEARRPSTVPSQSIVHLPTKTYGRDASAPFVVLRPPPFPELAPSKLVDVSPWEALPQHVISVEAAGLETQDHTISRGDQEQFNLYLVFPRGGIIPEFPYLLYVPPIIDRPKFHHYGYRPLMPHVSLLNMPSKTTNDPWLGFYDELAWRLAGWNVLNDVFWSGTKTFQLMPHLHVGERLLDQSTWQTAPGSREAGQEFYIESIRHEFVTHQQAKTMVGVTRGLSALQAHAYDSTLSQAAQNLTKLDANVRREFLDNLAKAKEHPK